MGLRPDQSSILDNTNLSYFNGQQVPAPPGKMRYIVETQDRASIMSYTQDIANMTGITRGDVTNDPAVYGGQNGSSDRYYYPNIQSPSPVGQGYIQLQQHPQ